MVDRKQTLHVKLTGEERRMLAAVAAREGDTVSAWLRRQVREAYRKAFKGSPPPPKQP